MPADSDRWNENLLEYAMLITREMLTEKELSLLQFWNARRAGRAMPERADFVPEDLFPWIGFLHLLEPIDGGRDFRYAVFTTRTLVGMDKDMTGKRISDWNDDRTGFALQLYGSVLDHARPVYSALPERHREDWVVYSRLCLPLGANGIVTHIVSMLSPLKEKTTDPIPPTVIEM